MKQGGRSCRGVWKDDSRQKEQQGQRPWGERAESEGQQPASSAGAERANWGSTQ